MSVLIASPAQTAHRHGHAPGDTTALAMSPDQAAPRLAPSPAALHLASSRGKRPVSRRAVDTVADRDRQAHAARPDTERGPAVLADEIRRIRQRLASPGTLTHPRVVTELHELYKQVAAGLDQRQGRHRRHGPGPSATGHAPGQHPAAAKPVPDASGLDLKPDPLLATTVAEFVGVLRRYRQWSGDPSYRTMAAAARQQVAHSTMYVALNGASLPKLKVVLAIVVGCGGTEADQRAFASAWRRVRSANSDPPPGATR